VKFKHEALAAFGVLSLLVTAVPARAASPRAAASAAQAKIDDGDIETRIENRLKKDSVLAPRKFDVESKDGHVTLTGTVRTATEKARAARLAKVTGVSSVDNQVEVDANVDRSKIDTASEKTKAGLSKAVDATKGAAEKVKDATQKGIGKSEEGVSKAAEKTSDAVAKAGDKTADAALTAKVKSSFADEALLKETAIDIDTTDHVVTLKGTVPSATAKEKAGSLAAEIDGVTRVDNQLVVMR
jgi:osmotically-inducible protein OsmY